MAPLTGQVISTPSPPLQLPLAVEVDLGSPWGLSGKWRVHRPRLETAVGLAHSCWTMVFGASKSCGWQMTVMLAVWS